MFKFKNIFKRSRKHTESVIIVPPEDVIDLPVGQWRNLGTEARVVKEREMRFFKPTPDQQL